MSDIDNITYLKTLTVTEHKVKQLLAKLKTDRSQGPDGIHYKVIYEARDQLLYPLTELFRTSTETGDIPAEWKMAYVVPMFKKGLKSDPNNYRPVSTTPTVGKLLETVTVFKDILTVVTIVTIVTVFKDIFHPFLLWPVSLL